MKRRKRQKILLETDAVFTDGDAIDRAYAGEVDPLSECELPVEFMNSRESNGEDRETSISEDILKRLQVRTWIMWNSSLILQLTQ